MFSRDKYHGDAYLADVEDYAPSRTSDSLTTHSSPLSCEERGTKSTSCEKDLPAIDGGIQAWLFLTASAVLEALVWGKSPA
jgi:hypothetical protein